uniref:Uncharacterized protein n=1 Tax=Mustela putorius furo TaxID=9669 RepID=M3XSN8_MUSPF
MPGKASSSRPVALNEMGTGTVWTAPGPRLHPGPSGIRCCPPAGTPHPRPRHLWGGEGALSKVTWGQGRCHQAGAEVPATWGACQRRAINSAWKSRRPS